MSEPIPELPYDPTKPWTERIPELVERTRTNAWALEFASDGRYRWTVDGLHHDSADGIGTKGVYHWKARTLRAAAQDAAAMNFNDLAIERVRPAKLVNEISLPKDDGEAIVEVIGTLAEISADHQVGMTAGETAIKNNEPGIEVIVALDGIVQDERPVVYEDGDIVFGIPSTGIHSNGWSTVRKIFGEDAMRPEFTVPTRIFAKELLELQQNVRVNGMTHVTGGAFTKPKLRLQGVDMHLVGDVLPPHDIMREIYDRLPELGVARDKRMYTEYNSGIACLLSVARQDVDAVTDFIPDAQQVGIITKGAGRVRIQSAYSGYHVYL